MSWRPRRALHFAVLALVALFAGPCAMAWLLTRPAPRDVGPPPPLAGTQRVEIALPGGGSVVGWDVPVELPRAALLVLHGRGSSRGAMTGRAGVLARARCASLLLDLPGHGESAGEVVSLGAREAAIVVPALEWLRARWPGVPVGALGISMGGAALCLAPQPLGLRFLILESTYATLEGAIEGRLARAAGPLAGALVPLAAGAFRVVTGIAADSVRPVDTIGAIDCPLLLLHGRDDRSTPFEQALALLEAARTRKQLAAIAGAGHEDLLKHSPAEWERLVLAFVEEQLAR